MPYNVISPTARQICTSLVEAAPNSNDYTLAQFVEQTRNLAARADPCCCCHADNSDRLAACWTFGLVVRATIV
ncbi:unnamed protein product, partial [Protopolystoma xenopodis]